MVSVLTVVAQLVMIGRNHLAVRVDSFDVPVAVVDPAASDDPAVALAYQLIDARNDPQRLDGALAAVWRDLSRGQRGRWFEDRFVAHLNGPVLLRPQVRLFVMFVHRS